MVKEKENKYRLYWFSQDVVYCFARLFYRLEVFNTDNVPDGDGMIIAANHSSYLDPPILGCCVRNRMITFMARDSLFRFRLLRWFFNHVGVIPIDRNKGDVSAMRTALRVLKKKGAVCLFPEGTRSPDGELQNAKGGVGFLLAKAAVPVVPAYIDGTYKAFPKGAKWFRRSKIRIFYGEPVTVEEIEQVGEGKSSYDLIGKLVMDRIRSLKMLAREHT